MPVDLDLKAIQIHIPKTGGSSVSKVLGLTTKEKFFSETLVPEIHKRKTPQHLTALELKEIVAEHSFNTCFKFTFIRNPYDRFVSEFFWNKAKQKKGQFYSNPVYLSSLDKFTDVFQFSKTAREDIRIGFDGHIETQSSFIFDESGNILVDFIGRFERLEQDFKIVCNTLGVPIGEIPVIRASERDKDYRKYYSSYTKKKVMDFYAEDIEYGDYIF